MYKNNKFYLKNLCSVACCLFAFSSSWTPLVYEQLASRKACFDSRATWVTIIYQYSTIGEFLPLIEMRCVRPLPFLMTGQS